MTTPRRSVVVLGRLAIVAVVVATAAAALGGAELAVRWRDAKRDGVPARMPTLYYRHQRLGFALVRDTSYGRWVHVDSLGLRGPEATWRKAPGTLRILALGASTTFDMGVSADSLAWPAQLGRRLTASLGRPVEVLNAGTPGYHLSQNIPRLHEELAGLDPDLVLVLHGHNELYTTWPADAEIDPRRPQASPAVSAIAQWLESHSLLYAKLAYAAQMRTFGSAAPATGARPVRGPAALDSSAARWRRDLRLLLATAQIHGLRVAFLEPPHISGSGTVTESDSALAALWQRAMPKAASADAVLAGYERFWRIAAEEAARAGIPTVPSREMGLRGAEWYVKDDPIHFNDRGATKYADALAPLVAKVLSER